MAEKVKATIKTKYSEITIESDRQTIQDIVATVQRRDESRERFMVEREKRQTPQIFNETKAAPTNATEAILKLKSEEFFKTKKSLSEVRNELERRGFIYPNTTLSPLLLKLVKRGELGRLSEGGVWVYVHR